MEGRAEKLEAFAAIHLAAEERASETREEETLERRERVSAATARER